MFNTTCSLPGQCLLLYILSKCIPCALSLCFTHSCYTSSVYVSTFFFQFLESKNLYNFMVYDSSNLFFLLYLQFQIVFATDFDSLAKAAVKQFLLFYSYNCYFFSIFVSHFLFRFIDFLIFCIHCCAYCEDLSYSFCFWLDIDLFAKMFYKHLSKS